MNPCIVPVPITSDDDRWISIVGNMVYEVNPKIYNIHHL